MKKEKHCETCHSMGYDCKDSHNLCCMQMKRKNQTIYNLGYEDGRDRMPRKVIQ